MLERVRQLLRFALLINICEPFARCRSLTLCNVKECLLDLSRDFTTFAVADLNSINGTDRRDFRRGTAEEEFVGDIQRSALNTALFHGDTELVTNLDDAVTCDASEYRGGQRRRKHRVAGNHEDVLAGTF